MKFILLAATMLLQSGVGRWPTVGNTFQATATGLSGKKLSALTYKTGWIALGEITADRKRWAAGSDPTTPYLTGGFEILGKTVDRRKPILPQRGDRIRLTARQQVLILDFGKTGEKRRLDSPSSTPRRLMGVDDTECFIEAGDTVRIDAVRISRPYGEIRIAWARVSPDTK